MRLVQAVGETVLSERERWMHWLPVAMAGGVALYFALPFEPPLWPVLAVAAFALAAIWFCRRDLLLWLGAVALAAVIGGFALACLRAHLVAAPVLAGPSGTITVEGRIRDIQPLATGERLLLDRLYLSRKVADGVPDQVRVTVRANAEVALHPGDWVRVHALLFPPPPPVAPGAFDFARQAWFDGLGGVGLAFGRPVRLEPPSALGWMDKVSLRLASARQALSDRIIAAVDRTGVPAGTGAVASALITGERGPVPPDLLQAYRDAGLAHVLVIAGMHMSMVAGLVFFALRGLLAAIPPIALRYPIKKWTALVALLVTAGYLVISGAPVPTQRAFIMSAIVLVAILADRQAISLRSISWAALAVLVMRPEALLGPSFQMSFASVVGLVAAYEALGPRLAHWAQDGRGWWGHPLLYLAGITTTTLVATAATGFLTLYHFNRYASYSLIGNLLAVPVVGFWVMPAALLAMILLPFGLDGWGWALMGRGLAIVDQVALRVAGAPHAAINLPAMPVSALALFCFGGLWLCLWRRRWRLFGLAGMATGILVAILHHPPDILISPDGRTEALRAVDGSLAFGGSDPRRGASLRADWARLSGEGAALPPWPAAADGSAPCAGNACRWQVAGRQIVLARPGFTARDCGPAELVLAIPDNASCPQARLAVAAGQLMRGDGMAIWLRGDAIETESVADWQGPRLWRPPAAGGVPKSPGELAKAGP